jgi:hypothetical protein
VGNTPARTFAALPFHVKTSLGSIFANWCAGSFFLAKNTRVSFCATKENVPSAILFHIIPFPVRVEELSFLRQSFAIQFFLTVLFLVTGGENVAIPLCFIYAMKGTARRATSLSTCRATGAIPPVACVVARKGFPVASLAGHNCAVEFINATNRVTFTPKKNAMEQAAAVLA